MYFDENILRIIYAIPDDLSITEEKKAYLEVTLQAALEALVVFKALGKEDSDFQEESTAFNSLLEDDESDLETAMESLVRLRRNSEFNDLYESYLDVINEKLISSGIEKNPQAAEELSDYAKTVKDTAIVDYIQKFIEPLSE